MESQDRRIRRTQHLLAKALITLTLEKDYEHVTIREITERADIGYATFFRHYHDKDELLKDVLDVVLSELIDLLDAPLITNDPTGVGVLLFRYAEEHSEVVRVLLRTHALRKHLLREATRAAAAQNNPPVVSSVPFEIAINHIIASSIALIEWWVDHEMPYSIEKMGTIYAELIAQPTTTLAF
jgi:AcrR family transcriptional regulator